MLAHPQISQRLAGLAQASVQLIPERSGAAPRAAGTWQGQWTSAEKAAAEYYENQGYEVIRLSHDTAGAVGKYYESRIRGASQLAHAMRRVLPATAFQTWIATDPKFDRITSLAYVAPQDYPVSAYPPDFLCARGEDWRFVEVKGPGDCLHFRQANWLINCRDPTWQFEVCMPIRGLLQAHFVFNAIGPGSAFAGEFAEALTEHEDFLVIASLHNLAEAELIAAEDRNLETLIRYYRRLWSGMAANGHDPRYTNFLRSGRPMSAIDPNWPPELTKADLKRMEKRNTINTQAIKLHEAYNIQIAHTSQKR